MKEMFSIMSALALVSPLLRAMFTRPSASLISRNPSWMSLNVLIMSFNSLFFWLTTSVSESIVFCEARFFSSFLLLQAMRTVKASKEITILFMRFYFLVSLFLIFLFMPSTTITNSPLGSVSVKWRDNSSSVPRVVSSWIFEISRVTDARRSLPNTSANCCRVFTTRYGDS